MGVPDFFDIESIELAAKYHGQLYDSKNKQHQKAGETIQEQLVEKVKYWVNSINVPGFTGRRFGHWLQYRYFADYAWAQLFKPKDSQLGVYFTVGVDFKEKALVYKLDCQSNAPKRRAKSKILITEQQIKRFRTIVHETDAEWKQIDLEELMVLNWPDLVGRTKSFVEENKQQYDRVIRMLFKTHPPGLKYKMILERTAIPSAAKQQHNTNRRDIHFDLDNINNIERLKEIGDAGEKLVMEYEKQRLTKAGRPKLAKEVKHVARTQGPEAGYDILSFDLDGSKKFIEVKTTVGNAERMFYLTSHEVQFSKVHPSNYFIYRLYEFDLETMSGKYFELPGNTETSCKLKPVLFRVSPAQEA